VSSRGLDIALEQFPAVFSEVQVPYSNALHCFLPGGINYLVGPTARYFLNWQKLSKLTLEVAASIGFRAEDCRNPFKSVIVRSLETLYACDEAIRIIEEYIENRSWRSPASVRFEVKRATGHGCTEAPRGLLYHRYRINDEGLIEEASIVPPTSQNQKTIELDLLEVARKAIHLPVEEFRQWCERMVRNYDPCISCSAHFLRVEIRDA
jgi:coenzyme F420-reducing hydrogenase alpha subunit